MLIKTSIIKGLLILSLIALFLIEGSAQTKKQKFAEKFIVGTSVTYIGDYVMNLYRHHEWTWKLNVAINIDHHFMIGLNNLLIFTHGTRVNKEKFDLYGAFVQYDFFDRSKNRLYGELGFYKGDYCTCGYRDPYKVAGLNYLNFGAGYELSIHKNFNLEFGFSTYRILNKTDEINNAYTQYVAGINYVISK